MLRATEAIRITAANYDEIVPAGKEVDAIIGDWVLRNEHVVAVIAQPTPTRKANMTVRGVGGTLIDFTHRSGGSDQLSCFYPAGGRFTFTKATGLKIEVDGFERAKTDVYQGEEVAIVVQGTAVAGPKLDASVRMTLRDDERELHYETTVTNRSTKVQQVTAESMVRCDGDLFQKAVDEATGCYVAQDVYFRQTYAFSFSDAGLVADNARGVTLGSKGEWPKSIAKDDSVSWSGAVVCTQGKPSAITWCEQQHARRSETSPVVLSDVTVRLKSPRGSVQHAVLSITRGEGDTAKALGEIHTDADGYARMRLGPGTYLANVAAPGRPSRSYKFLVLQGRQLTHNITIPAPSRVRAKITDGNAAPIPAKVQFIAKRGSQDPDFGPTSATFAVKNVVYTASGDFTQEVSPGEYMAIVSHGNEYDAAFVDIVVKEGLITDLSVSLERTVDTRGWVSTEYHSHSSPSGDNVSDQLGRVLNLLAENLEFAPCTEHNRIDTYEDDLLQLGATSKMATCTGMELTGGPLPVNHQNAFPLVHHQHTQDGGGPQTDSDPVKQIERLALWDSSSDKVVQSNHPNLPQILGDKNLDGKPDDGFRGMLGWMDVVEVHPPALIFETPPANISPADKYDNRIFAWMQLLNLGYRIPGVVNTDAHYNFHGSGWLRNYVASSTDDPAEIKVAEMVESTERGHIVMTTGPFLEVGMSHGGSPNGQLAIAGDDVVTGDGLVSLYVRVQCPNWFDINRVQVFANGRALKAANFTRRTHPKLFSDATVRFEHLFTLPKFDTDTHVIVATIGEGLELGRVMGPEKGKLPPVAVSNPIFVDIDGNGFEACGDDLGVPFMVPHAHTHQHE
ncbi:MAG: hypothetical protein Aurels2KO_30960 [Aureliella sp.]